MSGSGSGGSGGGFANDEVACDRLTFETTISSPAPAVVAQLKVGDVLQVDLRSGTTETIVLVFNGQDAGGIVSPKAARLRECIRTGTVYKATVVAAGGNLIKVRIVPV